MGLRPVIYFLLTISVLVACSSKPTPLAELRKAEGPVDRQPGSEKADWVAAAIGTGFFIGDAARTADGGATLDLTGGKAKIAMQPRTVLRFGRTGKGDASKLAIETGAIDLSGTGAYSLDVGGTGTSTLNLKNNGAVRITATGKGSSTLELTGGDVEVTSSSGQTIDLALGKPLDMTFDVPNGDAGVVDAGVADAAEPPDAPPVIVSGDSTVEVTGKKAEMLEPGTKAWKVIPAGMTKLAKGAKLRVGAATTAKVTSAGAMIEIGNGSRVAIDEKEGAISVETGGGRAEVISGVSGKILVPGGMVAMSGGKDSNSDARIDVARETKIAQLRGSSHITGGPGAELDLNRGESATIGKTGVIHPLEAIPTYFDFKITVGETVSIHDPKGATAVRFDFGGKCTSGVIEIDHDARFRAAKISAGKDAANLLVGGGSWAYRLRCSSGGGEGSAVASGRIAVTRDDGRRALPKAQPTNDIDADGRNWRISYQSVIPNIRVLYKGATGSTYKLHLASGGKEETFDGNTKITVPGAKLHEGTYQYWFDRDGVKDQKVSQLKIDFDQTAPQVYIELPVNGKAWAADIEVKGAVLVGWTAAVAGITIPIDSQRRFTAKVPPPDGNALAIKLSHPQRGVHYYLRRAK